MHQFRKKIKGDFDLMRLLSTPIDAKSLVCSIDITSNLLHEDDSISIRDHSPNPWDSTCFRILQAIQVRYHGEWNMRKKTFAPNKTMKVDHIHDQSCSISSAFYWFIWPVSSMIKYDHNRIPVFNRVSCRFNISPISCFQLVVQQYHRFTWRLVDPRRSMASQAISALATGAVRFKIQPNASQRLSQVFFLVERYIFICLVSKWYQFPLAPCIKCWFTLKVRKYAKCR